MVYGRYNELAFMGFLSKPTFTSRPWHHPVGGSCHCFGFFLGYERPYPLVIQRPFQDPIDWSIYGYGSIPIDTMTLVGYSHP